MKSKFNPKLFLLALALPVAITANAQVTPPVPYQSVASGDYNDPTYAPWQMYSSGSWVTPTGKPGSKDSVVIQSGNTLTGTATCGAQELLVQSGGVFKWGGSPATAAIGLRIYGTSLTNNGTIGGNSPDDSINIEFAGAIAGVTTPFISVMSGSGLTRVNRIRILGGIAVPGLSVHISQPLVTLTNQSSTGGSAVGLTGYYGSSSLNTDYDTVTIDAGSVCKFINGAVLHFSSANNTYSGGKYFYNINGVADMSASVGTSYLSPVYKNASGLVVLNVNGTLKLGAGFSTIDSTIIDSAGSTPGSVQLNVLAGGIVDATPTDFKMDPNWPAFTMAPTAIMKRNIPTTTSGFSVFPVSPVASGNNTFSAQNSGTADTFSLKIQTFSLSAVTTDPTQVVNREWILSETGTGAKFDSLKFKWLAAEQGSNVGSTPSLYYRPTSGTTQEITSANITLTGSGTLASPYLAVVSVPSTITASAGTYYIGKPGLPTAVANVANAGNFNVTVAPNPATNKVINFQLSGNKAGAYNVVLYNLAGQAVYHNAVNYNANTTNYTIDVNSMPAGVYQLQVNNGDVNVSKRVIVE